MFPSFHYSPLSLVIWLATVTRSRFLVVHALAVSPTTPTAPAALPVPRPPLRFFIGGLGYTGQRLADRLRLEFPDSHIAGCVRSEDSKQRLLLALAASTTTTTTAPKHRSNDLAIHVLDLDQEYRGLDAAGLADLQRATHVIQTIAPISDLDRDPLLALHSETLLSSSSSSSSSSCWQWVGYLSSTGVYGDHGGDWVDEDSELKCRDAKSLARVRAEQEWRDLETNMRRKQQQREQQDIRPLLRVDCFRCGGIYGPGRGPLATALATRRLEQAGTTLSSAAILPEAEEEGISSRNESPKYVNRILVDDICGALIATIKANIAANTDDSQHSAAGGSIYNLVDDDPAPRRHVVEEANQLVFSTTIPNAIKRQTPSASSLTLGEALSSPKTQKTAVKRSTSRSTGNKRCKNQRLKDAFHWTLLAPTFREGLRICLESYDKSENSR
jgi:nucleoside-diphosphate-sugar epimerase